ncbi:MAG: ATP synthase F1 subunit epsilon [Solirubrobacterales bacterium]|nr:ATP synthase F1 subunit epsilon [Solirubrobacterales bacterium]
MADATTTFRAEVLTPNGKVYDGEMFQVSVRTVVGEVGIRARHAPMLARLVPHEMRLFESESDFGSSGGARRYAAAEGWLEVFANKVTVLVTEAIDPDQLDVADLKARIEDAEGRLESADEESAAHRTAEQDKVRAEAFLEIANGS